MLDNKGQLMPPILKQAMVTVVNPECTYTNAIFVFDKKKKEHWQLYGQAYNSMV